MSPQAKRARAKLSARERIAAERAARKRAEMRRRLLAPIAAGTAVLAIVVALVAVKLTSAPPAASESLASSTVVRQVTTVPDAVLTGVSPGQAATPLQAVKAAGPPLAVALSHFGTWSHLGFTRSSATDVYPNTATLSFRAARFRSAELTLRTTELTDNVGRPLQAETALDTSLIDTYDVPPYVNSADQSGAVPFLDIGNHYILAGAQYTPQLLAACPRPRSPVSSASPPARWQRLSTGQRG